MGVTADSGRDDRAEQATDVRRPLEELRLGSWVGGVGVREDPERPCQRLSCCEIGEHPAARQGHDNDDGISEVGKQEVLLEVRCFRLELGDLAIFFLAYHVQGSNGDQTIALNMFSLLERPERDQAVRESARCLGGRLGRLQEG